MKEKIIQWLKKNGINVILFLVVMLLADITYTISNYLKLESIPIFNKATEIVFSSFIGLIGIWATGYFILIQLYKNSYPMEVIERVFQKKTKLVLTFSMVTLIVGLVTLICFDDWLSQVYYYCLFVIFTICIFVYTYKINKDLTINTYIEKYFNQLKNSFENKNITEKEVKNIFKEFYLFFDDCAMKEEYYVCNNISNKTGELFKSLIENCNRMLINGEEKLSTLILEKIIRAGNHQINIAKTCKSTNLLPLIISQQEKNIEYCMQIGRFEWFKKFIQMIVSLFAESKDNEMITQYLWGLIEDIGQTLMDNESDDIRINWLAFLIEEVYRTNLSLKLINKDLNLKDYCHFIVFLYCENINKNNPQIYTVLKENLEKFTYAIFNFNGDAIDFVVNYIILGRTIIEKGQKDMAKDLIDIMVNPSISTLNNERWNEFFLYFLTASMKKWEDEFGDKNRKYIVERIIELSALKNERAYYSALPDYKTMILENKKNNTYVKEICEELEGIIRKTIINNDIRLLYRILNNIKDSITSLKREDKMSQEDLFKILLNTLNQTVNMDNKQFLKVCFFMIDETIEKMDSDKSISDDFGNYIINEISNTILHKQYVDEESTINIIILLSEFDDKEEGYRFVQNNNQKKKLLYRTIYNIGINCIENNMEKALRHVSNTLGWKIIHSIEAGNESHTRYLIDRTVDLFKIAVNMRISQKTQIFILTLFTTVGTFCLKKPAYMKYLMIIIDFLHKESDIESIRTAIELRTKENNIWDELFENKTQELTSKFLTMINNK